MFLKQIKIVGFKSFVEPTVLHFNSERVAVVGPNGCGKSNVIDAIRWVMGESSPKFLRGDLMSDVIFNGSLHRKALGMASVELLLDNKNKFLQGAYVGQGEIALRREVNRSGDSSYYINGKRVRRKDLTDLWLGTGAGSRGYAIIGQNMVNQLVEANPDVLKIYLEEAAGVSKYKERRKESAERLIKVEENILRIKDILFELTQQLERLEVESKDAQEYQNLRHELRRLQDNQRLATARKNYQKQKQLTEKLNDQLKEEQTFHLLIAEAEQNLNLINQKIADVNAEIRQHEQSLLRMELACEQYEQQYLKRQETRKHYLKELESLNQEKIIVEKQKIEEEELSQKLLENIIHEKQNIEQLLLEKNQYEKQLMNHKELLHQQHQTKKLLNQKIIDYKTQIKILMARIEQSKMMQQDIVLNQQRCQEQINSSKIDYLLDTIKQLKDKINPLKQKLQIDQESYDALNQQHQVLIEHLKRVETDLKMADQNREDCRQQVLEKEATYKGLLNQFKLEKKLTDSQWKHCSTWLETWQIPNEWQKIIDELWQLYLPDYISDDAHLMNETLSFGHYAKLLPIKKSSRLPLKSLVDVMGLRYAPCGILDWSKIYLANSSKEATFFQKQLESDESILCLDGIWVGKEWIHIQDLNKTSELGLATTLNQLNFAKENLMLAEKEYKTVVDIFENIKKQFDESTVNLNQKHDVLIEMQTKFQHLIQQEQQLFYEVDLVNQSLESQKNELQRIERQYAKLLAEQTNWQEDTTRLEALIEKEEKNLNDILPTINAMQINFEDLERTYSKHANVLETKSINMTKSQAEHEFLLTSLPKINQRLNLILERIQSIDALIKKEDEESFSLNWVIEQKNEMVRLRALTDQRKKIIEKEFEFKTKHENELNALKQKQLVMMEQKWRLSSEIEQIQQIIAELKQIYKDEWSEKLWENIEDKSESDFKKLILDLENRLGVLGDVNLLAVSLFEQEKKRHSELSLQLEDLQTAIVELETAVSTLDHDMQLRLEETLRLINEHLMIIFPQLFGGGEAKFVASCDNLLEATVSMHVQAPGKKQHRIQLLSGGEKALTAVALLFSIFSLNPAPFCLLDEVDAALDDANVQRLSKLIKTLSNSVQFVLITHNPLTMDAAEELIGVTMQEPGVSRVVSVNMAKALEMINKE